MWMSEQTLVGGISLLSILLLTACGTDNSARSEEAGPQPPTELNVPGAPWPLPIVADDLRNDTLLVQVTFDVGDGTHLMVASHVEENFQGLRLYHYRARPDSTAELYHVSAPGYDSWTMFPTIFGDGPGLDGKWILANFGERQSWGQKLIRYTHGFHDHGFMDVALPEWIHESDSIRLKRTSIAPHMRMNTSGDTTAFTFVCDSVYLYDDQRGGVDRIVAGSTIRYTWHPATGLELWILGDRRKVQHPV